MSTSWLIDQSRTVGDLIRLYTERLTADARTAIPRLLAGEDAIFVVGDLATAAVGTVGDARAILLCSLAAPGGNAHATGHDLIALMAAEAYGKDLIVTLGRMGVQLVSVDKVANMGGERV